MYARHGIAPGAPPAGAGGREGCGYDLYGRFGEMDHQFARTDHTSSGKLYRRNLSRVILTAPFAARASPVKPFRVLATPMSFAPLRSTTMLVHAEDTTLTRPAVGLWPNKPCLHLRSMCRVRRQSLVEQDSGPD